MKRALSVFMFVLLLVSMLTVAFNIQPVRASGTIYIRANGSIDPPDVPISTVDKVTYTFTGNISDSIVVERDNIMVDGAGYTLQGDGGGGWDYRGIELSGRNNVTIKNTNIRGFAVGIYLHGSSNYNNISGNNITANYYDGVDLSSSSNNTLSGNNITANNRNGVELYSSSSNNTLSGNNITANNWDGVWLDSYNNRIYHNNFINNTSQVYSSSLANVWDDGYPSGGNYWSDYAGLDQKCGPSQDHPGSDGIGDTPYVIGNEDQDNYPFMNPWTPPAGHNIAVVSVVSSKTVICQGFSGNITVYATNRGEYSETFNVTLSAQNQTAVNQTGLVGYWKFDEGSGTTAYDSSGNGNNGFLVNGPTWVAGKYGEALSFDGVNDYVEIAGNTDLNPYTSDWTVSAWVNLNKLCPYIYGQPSIYGFVILGKRQSEFDNSLTLLVHSGTNATSQARFGFIWDGSMQAAGAQSDLMNVFGWHHVVGVRRGGELYVYVDGVEYGPNNYLYAGNNITSTTSISSATSVRLACHGGWSYSARNGTIDEARIYDRALSAGEILAQYEGGIFTIQTRTVTLARAASATLAFVWNTTGVPYGNYTLSAYAWPVQGETETTNNNLTDSTVIVTHVGDVTGDGKCDIQDLARVSAAYGSLLVTDPLDPRCGQYWHPVTCSTCPHTPNTDITNDGKVDIQDLARTSANFGWHE